MSRWLNASMRAFMRRFMPGIAAALEEENQFGRLEGPEGSLTDTTLYLQVEDNGAEATIVAFAGMAVLYAAMPRFEFKKMLQETGGTYNFIFVRDVFRSSYRRAPDGSGDGIAFYRRIVSEALQHVGAKENIAIGMSGGGEAAFRISGGAPIHRIIAFNPAFPLERYGSWSNLFHEALSLKKLICEPGAYVEVLLVILSVFYLLKHNKKLLGREDPELPLRDYLQRAVPATLFYSARCRPDARQARSLNGISSVLLCPVESKRHNCLADMKEQGVDRLFLKEALRGADSFRPKTAPTTS